MAFLRAPLPEDYLEPIRAEKVVLRPPAISDYAPWATLRSASRGHLEPWEPTWGRGDLSYASYRKRLKHYARESRDDLGYAFFVAHPVTGQLLGGLNLSNVRRGAAQMATLGYWAGAQHTRNGYMTSAVEAIVPFAFHGLRLHRLEAAVMPSNTPSIRVLEKCGFVREGFAKSYLKINGAWTDHFIYGITADVTDALVRKGVIVP